MLRGKQLSRFPLQILKSQSLTRLAFFVLADTKMNNRVSVDLVVLGGLFGYIGAVIQRFDQTEIPPLIFGGIEKVIGRSNHTI